MFGLVDHGADRLPAGVLDRELAVAPGPHRVHPLQRERVRVLAEQVHLVPRAHQRRPEFGVVDIRTGALQQVPVEDEDAHRGSLRAAGSARVEQWSLAGPVARGSRPPNPLLHERARTARSHERGTAKGFGVHPLPPPARPSHPAKVRPSGGGASWVAGLRSPACGLGRRSRGPGRSSGAGCLGPWLWPVLAPLLPRACQDPTPHEGPQRASARTGAARDPKVNLAGAGSAGRR